MCPLHFRLPRRVHVPRANSNREKPLVPVERRLSKACLRYGSRCDISSPKSPKTLRPQSSQWILCTLTALLIAGGCSTQQLSDYRTRPVDEYRYSQVENGIAVIIDPLTDTADAEKYFGTDLASKGILAVMIIVKNGGATSVLVATEKIALGQGQAGYSPKGSDSAGDTATGMAAGLGASVLLPPLIVPLVVFLPIASNMIANSNEMKHNFQTKELRTKTLSPGESTSGFMYFRIPSTANAPIEQWSVTVELTDLALKRANRVVIPFQWKRTP
jgi:hypothetical protein